MRDVAALAGVSIKTVSRVVNAEGTVTPGLAAQVLEAVDRLDYRQNLTASSLRRSDGKSATIGQISGQVSAKSRPSLGQVSASARLRKVDVMDHRPHAHVSRRESRLL